MATQVMKKMVSRRLSILGLISAAAIVSGVLAGCGGSSASIPGDTSTAITADGGLNTVAGTAAVNIPASTTPQQVQVTQDDGSTAPVAIPANLPAIAAGDPLGVISDDAAIIDGLDIDDGMPKHKATVAGLTPGKVYWATTMNPTSWNDTGVKLASGANAGRISRRVAFPPGYYYILVQGPLMVRYNRSKITFQHLYLGVQSVPKRGKAGQGVIAGPKLSMRMPGNGGSTANSNYVRCKYPQPEFQSGFGYLKLTGFLLGNSKSQNHDIVNGFVTFSDPGSDGAPDVVPTTGIQDIIYLLNRTN